MTSEFEDQDLTGASFWGVLLRNARFRDVDFTGTRTHHVFIDDVEIDGFIDGLIINGVDVTDHVNANDPWQPLRGMLRPRDVPSIRAGRAETGRWWQQTLDRAGELTDDQRRRSVDGEWSFIETLRHLVFITDKWFTAPLTGGTFQAIGIPNTGSASFPWPGIEPDVDPSYDDVLATRRTQGDMINSTLDRLTDAELEERVEVPESGRATVLNCWHALLEEEFEHLRYARRDLDVIG